MGSYASVIYEYIRFISTAALLSPWLVPIPCESYYHHVCTLLDAEWCV